MGQYLKKTKILSYVTGFLDNYKNPVLSKNPVMKLFLFFFCCPHIEKSSSELEKKQMTLDRDREILQKREKKLLKLRTENEKVIKSQLGELAKKKSELSERRSEIEFQEKQV